MSHGLLLIALHQISKCVCITAPATPDCCSIVQFFPLTRSRFVLSSLFNDLGCFFERSVVCVPSPCFGISYPQLAPAAAGTGKLNRVREEKIAASYFWVRVRSVQEPLSSHASANLAQVSSQRLPPSHLAFRGAIQLGWPRMKPDVGRQPAAGIKIARKIKLIRDRRVRLLLWSAVYYQYSLGLRCLPWHHLRSRQH